MQGQIVAGARFFLGEISIRNVDVILTSAIVVEVLEHSIHHHVRVSV